MEIVSHNIELSSCLEMRISVTYKIILIKCGSDKKQTIKLYMEYAGVKLKEAKRCINNLPTTIVGNLSDKEVEKISEEMKKIGAKVLIKEESDVENIIEDALLRCPECGAVDVKKIKLKEENKVSNFKNIKRFVLRYRWYCESCDNEW